MQECVRVRGIVQFEDTYVGRIFPEFRQEPLRLLGQYYFMSVDLIFAEPEDYVRKHVVVEEARHKVIIWWSSCRHGVLVEAESCLEVEEANWQAG